jgi:hypothetical protein
MNAPVFGRGEIAAHCGSQVETGPARCRISRSKGGSKTEFKSQVAVEIGIHRPTKSLSNATTNNEAKRKLADNGTACGLERGLSG